MGKSEPPGKSDLHAIPPADFETFALGETAIAQRRGLIPQPMPLMTSATPHALRHEAGAILETHLGMDSPCIFSIVSGVAVMAGTFSPDSFRSCVSKQ